MYNEYMIKDKTGRKVRIKADKSEWGIITSQEDTDFFVAMFGDFKEVRLFDRNEIIIERI